MGQGAQHPRKVGMPRATRQRGDDNARDGKMLVTAIFWDRSRANTLKVSGYNDMRDQMRDLTRDYLEQGVSLVELDYQPK